MKHNEKIIEYKKLLTKYHSSFDLISKKGLEDIDSKIDDALAYAKLISGIRTNNKNILDIGSGNGLPGIIIAIALPHWQINLVERRKKRAAFLTIASSQLELSNTKVYLADVKDLKIEPQSIISAQAVAQFKDLYCLSRHLHSLVISLISRKGDNWPEEIEILKQYLNVNIDVKKPIKLAHHGNLVLIDMQGGIECQ